MSNEEISMSVKTKFKEQEPDEDFRLLTTIPTIDDLCNNEPFIRSAKIHEPYRSVEHYLDVQFRLLREDFLSPLRKGLNEYLDNGFKYRNQNVRIYKNVRFESAVCISNKKNVGIKLNFGVLDRVNWKYSRRLTMGSLVLLSSDNFSTIIIATVLESNEDMLKNGFVLIEPSNEIIFTPKMCKAKYTMLESKVFFEPYKAVTSSLKLMDVRDFPMKNYLVFSNTNSKLPLYFQDIDLFASEKPWLIHQKKLFDESQFKAYKHALTEEFALIQGPPGTGKTFIALKIVQTLLAIQNLWKEHGPILVVCYTNHALDQFLEGILDYTESIVRLGGGIKSEKLKKFALKEKSRNFGNSSDISINARKERYTVKNNLEHIMSEMNHINKVIKYLMNPKIIVPFHILLEYSYDPTLNKLQSNADLINWLLEDLNLEMIETLLMESSISDPAENENFTYEKFARISKVEMYLDKFEEIYPLNFLNDFIIKINLILENSNNQKDLHESEKIKNFLQHEYIFNLEKIKQKLIEKHSFIEKHLNYHPVLQKKKLCNNKHWQLYWKWIKDSYCQALQELSAKKLEYDQEYCRLNELNQLLNLDILQDHLIVGLTTSGAAKNQTMLANLKAPILLVEEAAEILEAHIVCSLTKNCQHVILIGDHKQLRPKVSDYELGRDFNLNISLFERFVRIRGECIQLRLQHRMRPEISQLITPSIYQTLFDHESVSHYPKVKGVDKNLFFLNHSSMEISQDDLNESYVNKHEVEFFLAFANHLIKQGYKQSEITILATYVGQVWELKKEQKKFNYLQDINIQTVDNYQGEENKIILLSLVRNNGEGKIGFLKEENRVCVALSRAKEGLYVMGNMDDLIIKNHIWPKLKKVLENQCSIGESIQLRCQIHDNQILMVKNAIDFRQCPGGGCSKFCNILLSCGHTCIDKCHIQDEDHSKYKCPKPCTTLCPDDHPCPLECWQRCLPCGVKIECELECGHTVLKPCSVDKNEFYCSIKVTAILPDCEHEIEKPCAQSIENSKCSYPCETALSCGHSCQLKCHVKQDPDHINYQCKQACTKTYFECEKNHLCKKKCYEKCERCPIQVDKERSCGHFYKNIDCSVNIEKELCEKPCKRELDCGHQCKLKCSEVCGNCQEKVKKTISSCGHEVLMKCCEDPSSFKCYHETSKTLPCGHELSMKCCDDPSSIECNQNCLKTLWPCGHPCAAECKVRCESTVCLVKKKLDQPALCGHIFSAPCHLHKEPQSLNLLVNCQYPCPDYLECGHKCKGTCGACFQGRIHRPCKESCAKILFCGHECDKPCGETCPPCQRMCEYTCSHGRRFNKKCYLPFKLSCKKKCDWGCEHRSCTRKCEEICNVQPCIEFCKKKLICRHPCLGFCGEPCPPLCKICDNDKLRKIYPDNDDSPDFRLVFLQDCRHSISNTNFMRLTKQSNSKLSYCPQCYALIRSCKRFIAKSNVLPQDIIAAKKDIKLKYFEVYNNDSKEIKRDLERIHRNLTQNKFYSDKEYPQINVLLNEFRYNLSIKPQNRLIWTNHDINLFEVYFDVIKVLFNIMQQIEFKNLYLCIVKNQILMIVKSIYELHPMTKQNVVEIKKEIFRFFLMVVIYNEYKLLEPQTMCDAFLKKFAGVEEINMELKSSIIDEKFELKFRRLVNKSNINEVLQKLDEIHEIHRTGMYGRCDVEGADVK